MSKIFLISNIDPVGREQREGEGHLNIYIEIVTGYDMLDLKAQMSPKAEGNFLTSGPTNHMFSKSQ